MDVSSANIIAHPQIIADYLVYSISSRHLDWQKKKKNSVSFLEVRERFTHASGNFFD
jgi:hypothetical protein